jgi:hypothetical protein
MILARRNGGPMSERTIVGIRPWLPWPLSASPWWTEPVRAERLAALRIILSALLLIDLVLTYLPHVADFYGPGSLGPPELFAYMRREPKWYWSVLGDVRDPRIFYTAMIAWILATASLMLGLCSRLSAVLVWVLANSFSVLNPYVENAGDEVRSILHFYLMISPCGAAWSLDRRLSRWWSDRPRGPVFIHPWALRLLFVQMTMIYFANGVYKFVGVDWPNGASLYYVLGDMTLTRWSYAQLPLPYALTRILTWTVLYWEMGFPLLMLLPLLARWTCKVLWVLPLPVELLVTVLRWLRVAALCFGVLFHLGIFVSMEIGVFPIYMICCYVPLLPWERWADRGRPSPALVDAEEIDVEPVAEETAQIKEGV